MFRNFCILLLTSFSFALYSQDNTPKYSNEFLSIGVSAQAMGMSNSVVASVDDATAGYWNPAALLNVDANLQLAIMHAEYFAGIAKYDYGSIAIPLKDTLSAIGFSLIRFGVDDIPNTLYLFEPDGSINYDNITSFSVADYAFIGSYARQLKWNNLKIGGNVKVIHRVAGEFATAWGFGLDVGTQMEKNNWRFGLMARDITSTFNAWSFSFTEEEKDILLATDNVIPENSIEITTPKLIAGVAYQFNIGENFGLMPEINADISSDGRRNVLVSADPVSIDPHIGIEANYKEFIYLRGGVGNIQRIIPDDKFTENWALQPNMGLGLVIGPIKLDYAYTNIGKQSEVLYSHVFSLLFDVNKNIRK
ncbi:MAG: PorV/PorQ family protein [Fimbriimonadaceae bacterium]|nr:PorV/PorQ family protein [Chitinophagales bacterium]